jgi:hypothetical protein
MSEPVSFDPRVVLRPRSLDEVLDLAMAYAREHKRDFGRMIVALVVPAMLLTVAAKLALELSWIQTWVLVLTLTPLLERAVITYAGRHLFGNTPRIRTAVAGALRRPFSALTAALLIPVPFTILLLGELDEAAIAFSIMVGMFWPFALAWSIYLSIVLNLEGLPLSKGMRRSSLLVSYRFGRALGFVLTTSVMRLVAVLMGDLILQFVVGFVFQLGEPFDTLFENKGSWASFAAYYLMAPYVGVARLFDYVDARTRLEGWDIQVRFKALATQAKERRAA